MEKINPTCVNASDRGAYCEALVHPHKGCQKNTCPFYKSAEDFVKDESKASKRCDSFGYPFSSRKEVMDKQEYLQEAVKKSKAKKRKTPAIDLRKTKISAYNYELNDVIVFDSRQAALAYFGITEYMLELLLKDQKETYKGYIFVKEKR